jgi:LacI family transcriptional regulator
MSDELLVATAQAVKSCGYMMPDDISLIAISDGSAPEFYNPRITHLYHSGYEIGHIASQRLIHLITEGPSEPEQIQIECGLVELQSVKSLQNESVAV